MRILDVSRLLMALVGVALISACGSKPEATTPATKIDLMPKNKKKCAVELPAALWFTTSNFSTGGFLGRLDLKTGELKNDMLEVGMDTQVFQDGNDGVFLLTRQFLDSVRVLRGVNARVEGYMPLQPARLNAQGVARDSRGRIWVTAMESNQVLVYSADLSSQVGSVDLSGLKESDAPDAVADLAQIAKLDDRHMVVTAQRMHRGRNWHPAAQSGLAVIDIETMKPVSSGLVDLVNPIQMAVQDGKVVIVGRGDPVDGSGATGRIAAFSGGSLVMEKPEDFPAKIIAADLSTFGEPPAVIAWYPNENKSCVQIGLRKLACDGSPKKAVVFTAIKRAGDLLFVGYDGVSQAQLWVVDAEGAAETKKYDMNIPIQSMSFGL